jgi:hypothetical protein
MAIGRTLASWTRRLAPTPMSGLSRAALRLLLPELAAEQRVAFLEQVAADCEALRAAGQSARALALVGAVDLSAVPPGERPEAALAVRRLAHRLRLSHAREADVGAQVAELLVDLLAERLAESSARAMPARQVSAHNDALTEVLALNLLREPFLGLAERRAEEVFDQALGSLEQAERQTLAWHSLGTTRMLRELSNQVRELREAMRAGVPAAAPAEAPAALRSRERSRR